MQVRGPLMVEHRLIEQVIEAMNDQLARIETTEQVDTRFIETCVDFLRTYGDRTHHGKEEEILFHELSKRSLAATDEQLMDELIAEHTIGRETTKALAEANRLHRDGDAPSRRAMREGLRTLSRSSTRDTSLGRTRSSSRPRGPTSPTPRSRSCWGSSGSSTGA